MRDAGWQVPVSVGLAAVEAIRWPQDPSRNDGCGSAFRRGGKVRASSLAGGDAPIRGISLTTARCVRQSEAPLPEARATKSHISR